MRFLDIPVLRSAWFSAGCPAVFCLFPAVIWTVAATMAGRADEVRAASADFHPGVLNPFNAIIGHWRGVGQPRRGSRRGAWQEEMTCRWDFSADRPAVRFDRTSGAAGQFRRLTLQANAAGDTLQLRQHLDDGQERVYRGAIPQQWPSKLVLRTDPDQDGTVYRCTIEQLSRIRLVMLFEHRTTASGTFRRTAGIGYTRSGFHLADSRRLHRECVVTGGEGTIAVQHAGRTWYVCCEGCRQAFEESPDSILAEYEQRQRQADSAP